MTAADHDPVASPRQVVTKGNVRVTVLTARLLRIEHAADGVFEDRATLAVVNRRFPAVPFEVGGDGDALTVDTGSVRLHCTDVDRPFSPRRLHARIDTGDRTVTWRFGQADRANLGGTVRTLDTWKGNKTPRAVGFDPETGVVEEWDEQTLGPGLLSRDGWVLVDDSASVVLGRRSGGRGRSRLWPVARPPGERSDLYLFGHGTDHRETLAAGSRLLGRQPLPPRYAFGYWYSRYYAYTDRELVELAAELDHNDVPADVLVIDMDWHRPGWTGYSWDRDLFPDPTDTLRQIRRRGLRVALNLHPADGVGDHEDAFEEFCERLDLDPDEVDRIPFDVTDPRFVDAYFELLHHPEEDRGVDFWWLDWQQGTDSPIAGLDPLAWLNHLHWDDQVRRRPNRRPLVFSRWGGLGAGRYPVGFSGDTYAEWESLAFQPHFTATAANVGYGYWSHDIGGHFGTEPDPELYTRWVQFGAHSPVLRTHGSLGIDQERRIWEYPNPHRTAMIDAVRHRYHLIPYIYGECRRAMDDGSSLVRPMYHEHPDIDAAHEAPGQYWFGGHMVVAPVVGPLDDDASAGVEVWLPKGEWFDVAHGSLLRVEADTGGWFHRRYLLSEVPTYVSAGTVLPGQQEVHRLDARSYPNLVVTAYPGASGDHDLYEDDGESNGHLRGQSVTVPLRHRSSARRRSVRLGPARGSYRGWKRVKPVEVRFVGEVPPAAVRVDGEVVPWSPTRREGHWSYDAAAASVVVSLPAVDLRAGVEVQVERVAPKRRATNEVLVDGYPGLARRLDMISESTRTLLGDDNRQVIALSQAVARVERHPSTLGAELEELHRRVQDLDDLLEGHLRRWLDNESLRPLAAPRASRTLAEARRLLATTREQFLR